MWEESQIQDGALLSGVSGLSEFTFSWFPPTLHLDWLVTCSKSEAVQALGLGLKIASYFYFCSLAVSEPPCKEVWVNLLGELCGGGGGGERWGERKEKACVEKSLKDERPGGERSPSVPAIPAEGPGMKGKPLWVL